MAAVVRLQSVHAMDFDLLWKLMNDADKEVRNSAIQELRFYFCMPHAEVPLAPALEQKIVAMLEKEVTPERITAAFPSGHIADFPAALVLSSAQTLDYLYAYHSFEGCGYDYLNWQRRVLRPLGIALGSRSRDMDEGLDGFMGELNQAIRDPESLMEVLQASAKGLDEPSLSSDRLRERLRSLWSHPLLGKDGPLKLMLLAELGPRMESLAPRILGAMPEGGYKQHFETLIREITEAIANARERLAPPAAKAAGEMAR